MKVLKYNYAYNVLLNLLDTILLSIDTYYDNSICHQSIARTYINYFSVSIHFVIQCFTEYTILNNFSYPRIDE